MHAHKHRHIECVLRLPHHLHDLSMDYSRQVQGCDHEHANYKQLKRQALLRFGSQLSRPVNCPMLTNLLMIQLFCAMCTLSTVRTKRIFMRHHSFVFLCPYFSWVQAHDKLSKGFAKECNIRVTQVLFCASARHTTSRSKG
jgi:hypothetical protein